MARSTITALNPWSFRQHSAHGKAAHAISYLAASRSHTVIHRLHRRGSRRMNAAPQSAFRLSLLREPNARTRADRFSVRATSRTLYVFKFSKNKRAIAQSGPGGARILVCGSSDRRYTVSATSPIKKPGVACDTGFCISRRFLIECHKRRTVAGVFTG